MVAALSEQNISQASYFENSVFRIHPLMTTIGRPFFSHETPAARELESCSNPLRIQQVFYLTLKKKRFRFRWVFSEVTLQ